MKCLSSEEKESKSEKNEENKLSSEESALHSYKTTEPLPHTHFLMTAVAHYNLAVEYEFINQFIESVNSINQAYAIVKSHIGLQHNLSKKIEEIRRKLIVKRSMNRKLVKLQNLSNDPKSNSESIIKQTHQYLKRQYLN